MMKNKLLKFANRMKKTITNGLFIFAIFYGSQYIIYATLPFDFFVNIQKQEYADEFVGSEEITLTTNRHAFRDIRAEGVKEIYFVPEDSLPRQLPDRIHSKFAYEKDLNDMDFEITFNLPKPLIDAGEYFINDTIEIQLPYGITKTQTFNKLPLSVFEK